MAMNALVGYTGFVGGNLLKTGDFSALYNSKNIEDAFGTGPDVLFFCGIRAEKYLANSDPNADMATISQAMENIERINPQFVVLISTIDVYKTPLDVDETTPIETEGLHAYGLNRYRLEEWVAQRYGDASLIVRLPGLYGNGLKKNFIYDLIHVVPSMLTREKMDELGYEYLSRFYDPDQNNFHKLRALDSAEHNALKRYLTDKGFTALNFTDSRAVFQFYNLAYLYGHINEAIEQNIKLLNIAVEPVKAADVYERVMGEKFANEIADNPPYYDYRSVHARSLGGKKGYLFDEAFVLEDVARFISEQKENI